MKILNSNYFNNNSLLKPIKYEKITIHNKLVFFNMKHNYISLGGGCDAAMVLTRLGLRNKSLGFDWLWNLDEGLKAVIKILQNKYQDVTTENCYTISDHYRFEKKMITYSSIPSIVHLHSNPMEDLAEHEKLVRRFQRFENILKDDSIKHFIYYSKSPLKRSRICE